MMLSKRRSHAATHEFRDTYMARRGVAQGVHHKSAVHDHELVPCAMASDACPPCQVARPASFSRIASHKGRRLAGFAGQRQQDIRNAMPPMWRSSALAAGPKTAIVTGVGGLPHWPSPMNLGHRRNEAKRHGKRHRPVALAGGYRLLPRGRGKGAVELHGLLGLRYPTHEAGRRARDTRRAGFIRVNAGAPG